MNYLLKHYETQPNCDLCKMEEEEEALRNYCRKMISRVRNNQQHLWSSEEERRRHKGARERERTDCERQVVAGDVFRHHRECNLPLPDCITREKGDQTSPNPKCQGPEVHTVPSQLISMLRLKTFKEEMKRAAEVELHDPAVCCACEQEQASLALRSFIWRKKTQLRFQTLAQTKHTLRLRGVGEPCNAPRWIWEELLGDVRVTAT